VAIDGALVLQTRPVETDQDAPWSTLRSLLRAGLSEASGLLAARRDALCALATLMPELADRFAPREVHGVADMATALSDALGAISEERQVALALDDAQWADGPSVAALAAAIATARTGRVALIITIAQGVGTPPRELMHFQSAVGRDIPGMTVRLGVLDEPDLAALVAALAPWCRDDQERKRLTRRIAFETGGNPFFAVTLLEALRRASSLRGDLVQWPPAGSTLDVPLPFSIPSLVRHAIEMRLSEVNREDLDVLKAAAVCGQVLDLELIARVSGRSVEVVERALPSFERCHLIQFDGRRYTFVAPIVAEVIRAACLTRGEKRAMQRAVCEALEDRTDLESLIVRVDLLSNCSPDENTYELALQTAARARASGAPRLVERALAAADHVSREAQLDRSKLDALRARP
jgi:hypothetical protein